MNAPSESELKRVSYRMGLFQRRGLTPDQAEAQAFELMSRDAEKDDRRMCLECRHFQRSRSCARGLPALPQTLQRCVRFTWQTPA
jgi:hypothetical protein